MVNEPLCYACVKRAAFAFHHEETHVWACRDHALLAMDYFDTTDVVQWERVPTW